ncbi:hypothetical protein HG535_0F03130 [Zygotorulaspora mrakii]|uniref:BAG domain-containing protein n=1 Tax=Zygotorulaspora mrakii TaxID=42260 RepID=A0A7H9B7U4_ZYGMR|nr:uncharacterized protein HG535_0F03130 [Zygotorulaspora mrakii]QLG73802.1 hypothetical protein HG535_0F03130 [Zygotorulaspora mrakii]
MEWASSYYRANIKPLVETYVLDNDNGVLSNALLLTGASAIVVSAMLWRSAGLSAKKTEKKKTKKQSKQEQNKVHSLSFEEQIESVWLRFNNEYKNGVDQLFESFDKNDEKKIYQRNYYNEMLLKLLIELDGIDLANLQGERKIKLKERRKAVIKEIQTYLRKLDKLR